MGDRRLCIYGSPPPYAAMAVEAKRSEAAGVEAPCCWVRITRSERGSSLSSVLCIARGIAHRLTIRRSWIRTRELGQSAQFGAGLAAMVGDG